MKSGTKHMWNMAHFAILEVELVWLMAIYLLYTKKPSFEIACISYVHDVQLFKTECYLRNQYGLKKLRDFTMSEGHRYSLVDIIHNIIVLGTTRTIISCEHSLWHGLVQLLVVNTVWRLVQSLVVNTVWRLVQSLVVNTVCGIVVPTA
jgi:hypothetical protein